MTMDREAIVNGVQQQAEWWLDERFKKVKQEKHATMEVNPFMAPLISALHGHSDFLELADFLLGGHFAIGHATGFGKLIDEKVLPKVFGTTKLDKASRAGTLFARSCFDNIDHVVRKDGEDILLSLKASKWTIQLGQAIQLNNSFKIIRDSFEAAEHAHKKVVIATFYGTAEKLTDKYDLVRGINTGANHDVHDLQEYVTILSGQEFWAWLGDHEDTQLWVLQGIQNAIGAKREALREAQTLMAEFRNSFARRFAAFIDADGIIDWVGILKATNGG
jgi:hypothetical protein